MGVQGSKGGLGWKDGESATNCRRTGTEQLLAGLAVSCASDAVAATQPTPSSQHHVEEKHI